MTATRLPRLSDRPPSEICTTAGFSEPVAAAIASAADTTTLLYDLMARREWAAAITLLAHALPKADAVWWACECARVTLRADEPLSNLAALEAAQAWVSNPSERSRRAAARAAAQSEPRSPCAIAAFAAFFSGGSIAAPDAPELPAPEHLCGTMVATAIMLAGASGEPEQTEARYQRILDGGIALARA